MANNKSSDSTYLGLGPGVAGQSVELLIPTLADTIFVYSLYKKYHWHVEGDDFYQYHLLFDKHAEEQLPLIDLIAERIRTLGAVAPGMPADVVAHKTLEEPSDAGNDDENMIQNLCKVHEAFISKLRQTIDKTAKLNDTGTNDMLVSQALRLHELQLWFVRSSLD